MTLALVRRFGLSVAAASALLVPLALPIGASATQAGSTQDGSSVNAAAPNWLHVGYSMQYPAEGGFWQYGFKNAAIRSYYTVNRVHGSTVVLNGSETVRSVDTAPQKKSIAEKPALNYWGNDDAYYYRVL